MQTALEESLIILGTLSEAYIRFDLELRFTFVNPAAERFLGRTRAELLGKRLQEAHLSDAGLTLEEGCRRALAEDTELILQDYSESWNGWCEFHTLPDSSGGIVVRICNVTDEKLLESALRKSEEKFYKAFRSSPAPMGIVDVDKNRSFMEVNDAFLRITGYEREEVIGRTSTELGLYEDLHDLDESRKRLLGDGGYRDVEIRFRKKGGDIIVGLLSAEQIEINGKLCAIWVAVDITERRQAEQALRESMELYRQLFELESDAIVLVDRESGQLLAANAAASALYGYSKQSCCP